MSNFLRMTTLAAVAAAMAAAPATAAPANPDKNATASARIIKPLVLTWVQDLSLGDILQSGAAPYSASVGISRAGVFSCANTNVVCSGTPQVAKYNVRGTQGQSVTINAGNVVMTNANDPTKTLTLTVDKPASVTLANAGAPGSDFSLGGSITVADTTVDGVYTGTFNVTVDY